VKVGIHARLENRNAAELAELSRVGFVVECAGDEHIEIRVAGLTRSSDEIGPRHGPELRPDEYRRSLLGRRSIRSLNVPAFRGDELARPRGERGEVDAIVFVRLLKSGGAQILQNICGNDCFA